MPFITQGKTNLKYILIVVILAVIVGGGFLGYKYFLAPKEPEALDDTSRIHDIFGNPTSFTIYYSDEDGGQREEVWDYKNLGIAISFAGGRYIETFQSVDEREETVTSPYSPVQLSTSMTLDEISAFVREEPAIKADLNPDILSKAKIYVYSSGLIVTTIDDSIVSIHFQ